MGLLDKSKSIKTSRHSVSLLDHAARFKTDDLTPRPVTVTKPILSKKKTVISFKDFVELSLSILSAFGSDRIGILYSFQGFFIPYIMRGFDKTTLHKFRLPVDSLKGPVSVIRKQDIKDVISLREYLNDSGDSYYAYKADLNNIAVLYDKQSNKNILDSLINDITSLSNKLEDVSFDQSTSMMYKSYEEIKPHLLTAELENLYVNTFSLSFSHMIDSLKLSSDLTDELFLLNIINSLLFDIFQRSAYSVKNGDRITLYLLSMSKQNQQLLQHQINRTISEFLYGKAIKDSKLIAAELPL